MAYRDEVKAVREQFDGAVEDAAAEALRIAEEYGKPLQVVCKDIAPEGWQALNSRARRLNSEARDPQARARRVRAQMMRDVRRAAKTDPEAVARELAKVNPQAVIHAASEVRASQPRLAKQELSIPARSMDVAWTHVNDVVKYVQAGNLTPRDREELPRVTPRVIKGSEFILDAIEGKVDVSADWDRGLAELEVE